MSYPVPENEEERLCALRQCNILDTEPEDAFDDLTYLAAYICDVPMAAISLVDAARQWFKSSIGYDVTETPRDVAFCAHTIVEEHILLVPNAAKDCRFSTSPLVLGGPNIQFYAGVPLQTSDGFVLGALCVCDTTPRELTPSQIEALGRLGRQVTRQLELKRHISERDESHSALELSERRLLDAQRAAHIGSWEWDVSVGGYWFSHEMFLVVGLDPDGPPPTLDEMRARYHPDDLPIRDSAINQAKLDGKPYSFDCRIMGRDGEWRWCHAAGRADLDEHGAVTKLAGTMIDITARKLLEEQLRDYSIALEYQKSELEASNEEKAESNRLLSILATQDGLTGLTNHRAFHDLLESEVTRADRYGHGLSMVMLDVDHFKQYNDAFGHPEGDTVLREVSSILKQTARTCDTVARYGGEEFVVLLPETNIHDAAAIAERFRAGIASFDWPRRSVTISLGVSTLSPDVSNASSLVACADAALYESKRGGRNRVTLYDGHALVKQ
ncbi:MAG TPA: diguanylate cyclase [Capsulimonadaceae bacterium]|jgi:diguanylate cyclase (GGDEF)-like protein